MLDQCLHGPRNAEMRPLLLLAQDARVVAFGRVTLDYEPRVDAELTRPTCWRGGREDPIVASVDGDVETARRAVV